jgi:Leucine-rich repeat (LRR) protein
MSPAFDQANVFDECSLVILLPPADVVTIQLSRGSHYNIWPTQVFELTNLTRLDIGHNDISEIPADIAKLTR